MPTVVVLVDAAGEIVCEHCELADNARSRMVGLLGRDGLRRGHGVLLSPGWAVHTLFMRFPIDVVFLDGQRRVLSVRQHVRPFRCIWQRGAREVLELCAGETTRLGIEAGTRLAWGKRAPAAVA